MTAGRLFDPTLDSLAAMLDDLEAARIAAENRLRQLTRNEPDKDGLERGYGLTADHPAVVTQTALIDGLKALEHRADLDLRKSMRRHPLGPWVKAQRGIGDRMGARLLAAIRDPYWNDLHDRPRTVSELWAYCGDKPGQKRTKGVKSNWSNTAKMRAYLIAESCMKQLDKPCGDGHIEGCTCSPYRVFYDKRKAHTVGRLHETACVRCGPTGKPAQPGSPWSDAHRHADALRVTGKEILKHLWREARDVYADTEPPDDASSLMEHADGWAVS